MSDMDLAKVLYDAFWERNKAVAPTAFSDQAPAIIAMWRSIASDALAALAVKKD